MSNITDNNYINMNRSIPLKQNYQIKMQKLQTLEFSIYVDITFLIQHRTDITVTSPFTYSFVNCTWRSQTFNPVYTDLIPHQTNSHSCNLKPISHPELATRPSLLTQNMRYHFIFNFQPINAGVIKRGNLFDS